MSLVVTAGKVRDAVGGAYVKMRDSPDGVDRLFSHLGMLGVPVILWTVVVAIAVARLDEPMLTRVWGTLWLVWIVLVAANAINTGIALWLELHGPRAPLAGRDERIANIPVAEACPPTDEPTE